MSGRGDRLAHLVVESCLAFHARRLWQELPGTAVFLLRVPGEEHPLAANVMGQNGEEFGLLLTRGPGAFEVLKRTTLDGDDEALREDADILSFSVTRLSEIPQEYRALLTLAGFHARREQLAPHLIVRRPHRQPRPPRRDDLTTLAWAVRTILAAHDAGELDPRSPDVRRRRVLLLEAAGELSAPQVSARFVPWPEAAWPAPVVPLLRAAELRGLPRLDVRWSAHLVPLPGGVQGDERTPYGFFVAGERDVVLQHAMVMGDDLRPAADALARAFLGEASGAFPGARRGLPREIAFRSASLHAALAPSLSALGLRATLSPSDSPPSELEREILATFAAEDEPARARRREPPAMLSEWKAADVALNEKILEHIAAAGWFPARALHRFFGSTADAHERLERAAGMPVLASVAEWYANDYRATYRSATLVEKLLKRKRLPPEERLLLEARRAAELSIYRVDSIEPGSHFEVEDVLSGRRHVVQDRALSGSAREGIGLPLRLLRVAEWTFPCFAGPPLGPLEIDGALRVLEVLGADLSPGGLRATSHLLGWLWAWLDERRAQPPQVQNTDGDPFEWHRGTFAVADPAALRAALAARSDVYEDEPGSQWTWLRPSPPAPGLGDSTTLARLEFLGESLTVEGNSARRFEQARAWVSTLPGGVTFQSLHRRKLGDKDLPLDDQLLSRKPRGVPSPELRAEIEARLREHYRLWLDLPVPALGGRTPRQTCASPAGRRQVARLIRTIPASIDVDGRGRIEPPRRELLAELGLAEADESDAGDADE